MYDSIIDNNFAFFKYICNDLSESQFNHYVIKNPWQALVFSSARKRLSSLQLDGCIKKLSSMAKENSNIFTMLNPYQKSWLSAIQENHHDPGL
jgi:hypothetical protein